MATTNPGQLDGVRATRARSLLVAFLFAVAGCGQQFNGPRLNVAGDAACITGSADLIHFRTDGGPTDIPRDVGPRLTRADAVRLALASDPDLQIALAKVRSAEADARQARLLPNPVLSVIVRFREGGGEPIITADLTADLLAVLQRPRRTRAADRHLRAAAADALTAVLNLVAGVEGAYDAVQSLDAQAAVLTERRAVIERLLSIAQGRLDAGEGTRLDVITAQGQRQDMEEQIADRDLQRGVKRLALARLIGRPSDAGRWQLDPWEPPPGVAGDEAPWVSAALANRPEVRARRWELAATGDEAALAASDIFKGSDVGAEVEKDITWTGGPSIVSPLPIFDWGQASRAKARVVQVQARHELTKMRRVVVEETRAAFATLVASEASLARVRAELIPLQEQRQRMAEDLYRAGESDLTALLVAEQSMQDARERAVLLQETAAAAMTRLHRAVGGRGVAAELNDRRTMPSTAPVTAPATMPANTTRNAP
jgi:outer membrane protein TolC